MQGDRGEFNQCQAQLKALYLEGVAGQEAEFVAYRILYLIMTHNSAGQLTVLCVVWVSSLYIVWCGSALCGAGQLTVHCVVWVTLCGVGQLTVLCVVWVSSLSIV